MTSSFVKCNDHWRAISLCFGEASCEIIYFDANAFRELLVTD